MNAAATQELRRSNAPQPIPARKPARRGGRGQQRRAAIRAAVEGK